MSPRPTCPSCPHLPHPARPCCTVTVTGPPSDQGRPIGDGYTHGGRTVTECGCTAMTLVKERA